MSMELGPGIGRRMDKRGHNRKRVLKGGQITFAARQTSVPCVVRDFSEGGAHLVVSLAPHLPTRFQLIIELDGLEADCEVAWRRSKEVGVRFVAPPRSATRRRVQVLGDAKSSERPLLRRAELSEGVANVPPPQPVTPEAAPTRAASVKNNTRPILIAEDDLDDQAFISEAFREIGFGEPVIFVNDGVELVQYLKGEEKYAGREMPGLILLDLNMPRMDGRTALLHIKSARELRRIPVVVFSTSNVERDIETTYDLGVASYIPKPSSAQELAEIAGMLTKYWALAVRMPGR